MTRETALNERTGQASAAPTCAACTDTGHRRPHNEDAHAEVPELGLYVVADGMGGHHAGEVASRVVVDHVTEAVRAGSALDQAVSGAHLAVLEAVRSGAGREGMGATVVAARMVNREFQVTWAGDSRAYLFGGRLRRLTRDHSVVQEMVDMGALSEHDARRHPERSLVTRAMGMPDAESMPVETVNGRLHRGQWLVLCSDGLTEELEDAEIEGILRGAPTPAEAAPRLVDAALKAGGSDNVTVMVLSAPDGLGPRVSPWRLLVSGLVGLVAAAVVGLALALAGVWPFA